MAALPAKISSLTELQWAAINRARQRWPKGIPSGFFDVLLESLEAAGDDEREVLLCGLDPHYFFATALKIYDAQASDWIPFQLWPEQAEVLEMIHTNQLSIALKARQLGLTWEALGYALWQMLFRAIATVLLFSRRDDEAMYLLSDERLKGMYYRLPEYLKKRATIATDNAHQLKFSNGSVAYAFPTTAGDSYTATFVIMDEADLLPNLNKLMGSVKPTIDAGGKLFMLSRVDKSQPNSEFKRIYQAARANKNGWAGIFLPWHVRPERTLAWYEAQKQDILSRTGSLDALWEQYPSTDTEALMPKTLDKRIAPEWLMQCQLRQPPIDDPDAPAIPGLVIYKQPFQNRVYVAGADPAEGNPTSDDSAATWVDAETGEEVAKLNGKLEPAVLASHIDRVSTYFNHASVLVERNNHGHAVLLWLELNSEITCSEGPDEKAGWLDNSLGKTRLYDHCADMFRDRATVIHSEDTYYQLSSIDGSTLRAPAGEMDDLADSYALALMAMVSAFSLNFFIGKARF